MNPVRTLARFCIPTLSLATALTFPSWSTAAISLAPIGTYAAGAFDEGAAEIVAHDPKTQRLFVVNGSTSAIDVLDISDPTTPALLFSIDITPYGAGVNSVAVSRGVIAAAVQADPKTDPGKAVFFRVNGNFLCAVTVGALPDMITFTPNGKYVLVANEGEPNADYSVDPKGSVSIIDISRGARNVKQSDVVTAGFTAFNAAVLDPSIRIFGPGATVAQDLEPEYIAVSHDSKTAWVTLQENNAMAVIDIQKGLVTELVGLGFKNHRLAGKGIDASDKDSAIHITTWPVKGMYLPDAIASFRHQGKTFLITANEGDAREYDTFVEETRVKSLTLDPTVFPNAATLQLDANLGRLGVTNTRGDIDNDGDYDQLYAFGARSFSIWTIWTAGGKLVFDSGDQLEQLTALALPMEFNSNNDANGSFDTRSDNKGPEPEGVTIGKVGDKPYAFIGLERIGGVAVCDISHPSAPRFVQYVNNRDFMGNPLLGTAGDLGPEGLLFVSDDNSPTGQPLLIVANEISGTTTIYAITEEEDDDHGEGDGDDDDDDEGKENRVRPREAIGEIPSPLGGEGRVRGVVDYKATPKSSKQCTGVTNHQAVGSLTPSPLFHQA